MYKKKHLKKNYMCKVDYIKKYLENFQKEILYVDKFEIQRKDSKYIKYKEYFEKFNNNAFKLAQSSEYFNEYILFCNNYKHVAIDYIKDELMLFHVENYYFYYKTIYPITFAVDFSINLIIKKKTLNTDTDVFQLNQDYKIFLTLYISYRIYDNIDIDKFYQPRFYKKRLLKLITRDIDYILSSNRYILIENHNLEFVLNNKKLLEKINKTFMKIIWTIEKILISLCFGLPYQSAGLKYEINKKAMSYIEHKIHTTENEMQNLEKEEIKEQKTLEETLITKDINSKIIENDDQVKYTLFPTRYLVFSKELTISRDITQHIHTKPGLLYKNKVKFNNISYGNNIYAYNIANNEKTSKFSFNLEIIKKLNIIPIIFSKMLFEEISIYFLTLNLKKKTTITQEQSMLLSLNKLFKDKNKIALYFPYLVDFRGRIYVNSPFSITNNRILRYIIEPNSVKINKNKYYKTFINYINLLEQLNTYNNIINQFSEEKKIILLVSLLNLGKINKVHLIENNNVSLEKFILEGIKIYNNYKNIIEEDLDKIVEIKTLKLKIDYFIKENKEFSIIVDSTASGIFHLNIWLNIKEENLKYINIQDREVWWDTYLSFFNITKNLMGDDFPLNLQSLFTRKRLKSLYMTLPYNAKPYTLSKYFYEGMTIDEKNQIKPHISNFIKAISLTFDNIFYTKFKNLNKISYFENKFSFELLDNYYDFYYYHTVKKQREVSVKKERFTYTDTIIKNESNIIEFGAQEKDINLKKTNTAFAANVMHCSDAMFLNLIYNRLYEKDIYIHTIHDEFIISVNAYFDFIEEANNVYMELYYRVNNKHIVADSLFIVI